MNSKEPSSSGPLSVLSFLLALPIWLLLSMMFLFLSLLKRLLSLLLRRPERKPKPSPVSFIRAPHIPESLTLEEEKALLDVDSDRWKLAALRRQKAQLETCLDYSFPDYDDDLR